MTSEKVVVYREVCNSCLECKNQVKIKWFDLTASNFHHNFVDN